MSGKFAAVMPSIFTCFVFEVRPLVISTALFGTSKNLARVTINSAFAAPSTGGDFTLIFNAPSCSPTISLFDDFGKTRTLKIKVPSFLVN